MDNGLFSIDPTTGAVTFIASPNFEVPTDTGGNNVYDIKIKVCDNGSPVLCATKDVAITVTDAVECVAGTTAPAITPTTATNTCPATTVDLSALANTGSKPAGTTLVWSTNKVPTSAADTLTNLTTVSTAGKYYAMYFDKVGNCYSPADSVDVTITACNLSPVITSGTTATTPENVGTTTPVYTATATDPDAGQTKTFSFETGGVDNGLFSIDPTTGAVTFIASPDFEVPTDTGGNNVYDIKIKVCDNGSPVLCATKDVAITVTDAVECVAGTTAPAITPTTATNTCPATTVDLSALANTGTKPAGTSLIWSTHKVPTSAGDTLTNLTTVSTAGKYYALYFDKIGNCYSPADSVEVMITVCATPFAVVNPSPQTATVNQPKTGTTPTELTPTGGTGPYVYSVDNTGSCVIPSGGTALPSTSNLTVTNSATGAYTYTAPATAGTYYYCIKVCDSSTPTASCITKTYTLTVTAACPVVGAAIPGLK
ncbi:MAG: cadherin repeat domain-containing protein [Arcicella sp.]|nr:cadherin repeat domain-containing protein [Arcicella sp.]